MSITAALEEALPANSVSALRHDRSNLCDFEDIDALTPALRKTIAGNGDDLRQLAAARVVTGHFSLPTLMRVTAVESIATVVREPRARVLSLYAYWATEDLRSWYPYEGHLHASKPLTEFLTEPAVARVVDNQLCRMLLAGDARVPPRAFIAEDDVDALAKECLALLARFGFVGVQEQPDETWRGLSRFFGVELSPKLVNVTHANRQEPRCPPSGGRSTCRRFARSSGGRLLTVRFTHVCLWLR